ncbi:MAG TPA: hypothetical protein DCZ02_06015 [Ruminococcaceae bacterium]|nr:hypothetical protein [Oscillospiraceae bacterium]
MPSTNRTENLKLNQWVKSDIPLMQDFNSDNEIVDNAIYSHTSNDGIHMTQYEKECIAKPVDMCVYYGDGKASQAVELSFDFEPSICLVFSIGSPLGVVDIPNEVHYNYFGIATKNGSSVGLTLSAKTLTVVQSPQMINKYEMRSYNEIAKSYLVVGFR